MELDMAWITLMEVVLNRYLLALFVEMQKFASHTVLMSGHSGDVGIATSFF